MSDCSGFYPLVGFNRTHPQGLTHSLGADRVSIQINRLLEHGMALDLASLQKALEMMRQVHARAEDADFMRQQDDITRLAIHAGVIQHFKIVYELCWKFIQRWVKLNVPTSEAEQPRTRKELFRLAARSGLLTDPLPWFDYGNARNRTAHTYNLTTAEEVYDLTGAFIQDAGSLLKQLEKFND